MQLNLGVLAYKIPCSAIGNECYCKQKTLSKRKRLLEQSEKILRKRYWAIGKSYWAIGSCWASDKVTEQTETTASAIEKIHRANGKKVTLEQTGTIARAIGKRYWAIGNNCPCSCVMTGQANVDDCLVIKCVAGYVCTAMTARHTGWEFWWVRGPNTQLMTVYSGCSCRQWKWEQCAVSSI